MHELLHELVHFFEGNTALTKAKVQRILKELLIIRANIEANGNRRGRPDTGTSDVERQLADGDRHAIDAEVAEAQNAGSCNIVNSTET